MNSLANVLSNLNAVPVRSGSPDFIMCLPGEEYTHQVTADTWTITKDATVLVFDDGKNQLAAFKSSVPELIKTYPDKEIILYAPHGVTRDTVVSLARPSGTTVAYPPTTAGERLIIRRPIEKPILTATQLSTVEPIPINWLWYHRIALGKLTVIAGQPGTGKTQIACDICAHVTTGKNWPCGNQSSTGNAVFISAEDDTADTIAPRLQAAGANTDHCFVVDNQTNTKQMLHFPSDCDALEAMLKHEIGNVKVIVIDPVSAYLGGTDQNSNGDVRSALFPVCEMAQRLNCAVIAISHLIKSTGSDAMARVSGSGAFVAAARACFITARNAEDPDGERLFLPAKNNIGNDNEGFNYSIEHAEIETKTGKVETSRIKWGAVTNVNATEALATPRSDDSGGQKLNEAVEFLESEMATIEKTAARGIIDRAKDNDIAPATLTRARKKLNYKATKEGEVWMWSK